MPIGKSEEKTSRTQKKSKAVKISYVVLLVILLFLLFKVGYFFKEQHKMKKYLKEAEEAKAMAYQLSRSEEIKEDVEGEDVEGVRRYPGMIRTWYVGDDSGKIVVYQVKAPRDKVFEFYKKEMESNGWKKKNLKGNQILVYTKDKRLVDIVIDTDMIPKEPITKVTILTEKIIEETKSPGLKK